MDSNVSDGSGSEVLELESPGCYVALTYKPLSAQSILDRVASPKAGANVLFSGTTRDNFQGKPVKTLRYSAYAKLALSSMLDIARSTLEKHSLVAVAIVHRLGPVPIGEQSILVGVSAGHRQAAWRGAEDALELVKARVEIWKLEEFEDEGVWRANRDGAAGVRVDGGGGSGSTDTCMVGIDTRAVTDSDTAIDTTDTADPADPEEVEQLSFGPVIRPRPLGERGHGPVVNFRQ